jgi:hypothetical protein
MAVATRPVTLFATRPTPSMSENAGLVVSGFSRTAIVP